MRSKNSVDKISRRQFAKSVAAIAAAPLVTGLCQRAVDNQPLAEVAPIQTSEPLLPDAERLLEIVRLRYGKNLTDAQMMEAKKSIDHYLHSADQLKAIKLTNADEPCAIFTAE
jgi:hypothetical protein